MRSLSLLLLLYFCYFIPASTVEFMDICSISHPGRLHHSLGTVATIQSNSSITINKTSNYSVVYKALLIFFENVNDDDPLNSTVTFEGRTLDHPSVQWVVGSSIFLLK